MLRESTCLIIFGQDFNSQTLGFFRIKKLTKQMTALPLPPLPETWGQMVTLMPRGPAAFKPSLPWAGGCVASTLVLHFPCLLSQF